MNVDFHIHTNNSDGSYSYDQVIKECIKNNIKYISITDHNNFIPNKYYKDIKIINGMEVDVKYQKLHLHMLLYNFNPDSSFLNIFLKRSRRHEIYRFHKYINLLEEKYHVNIDKKFIRSFIKNNNYFDTVRMNRLLVEYHICDGFEEAYRKYTHILPSNKRYMIKMDDFVRIANESNGIMSLAHPLKYKLTLEEIKEVILELKDKYNLQVIEAINNHQTIDEEKELVDFCKKNNLYISSGSDSHYAFGERTNKKIGLVLNRKITLSDTTFIKLFK